MNAPTIQEPTGGTRAEEVYRAQREALHRQTDRMFAGLMACQWPAAIAAALLLSPRTWSGPRSSLHPNLYLAVFLGGLLAALPIALALRRPGTQLTRHAIALCQMLTSALLIHVSGGRIETHFHIFGSLAFLSFYRDWRVLVTASVAVAADHMLRGIYAPASVFGVLSASSWRWVEHALWVVFEDAFLFYSCWRGTNEMRAIAARQAQLEATKDDVERQVVERSRELAQARDAALDASRVKSEFLANMSHEIRTPMNGILGMTAFLEETEMSAEQREYAHTVRTCSEALMTVIDDILDFSKIEAGKIELEATEFEPREVVEEVLDILAARAAGKGLELVSALAPALPEVVRGDPGRLRQVLLNFAGNAVKFTERGEVVVAAELASEEPERVLLRFEVRDTGIGIPPERMDRLFRSFSQVDSSHTRRFGGSGLGLVISKRLIELMGGTVGLSSEMGKGSCFWFTVALQRGTLAPAGRSELLARLGDQKVLVVDDNATNCEVFRRQLQAWGCRVQAVESPAVALDVLRAAAERSDPFDLALLDFQMPEMDGMELAAAIRATGTLSRTRLLLLTSVGSFGTAARARELDFAAVLTKPVRAKSLLSALLDTLAHAAPGAPEPPPALPGPRSLPRAERGRVLVAEDNPVNQRVAQLLLQRLGCSADVVGNGAEALVALERTRYDLVFMDCQMPVLDGFEATQRIRLKESAGRHTPIVATTAYATRGDRERCLAAGMDDYLDKPLRKEAVLAALERWLGRVPVAERERHG